MGATGAAPEGRYGVDERRRDFLKKAGVTGGLVWAAPTIATVGAQAAAGTPDPGGEECTCTSSGYALRIELLGDDPPAPIVIDCLAEAQTIPIPGDFGSITIGDIVCSTTTDCETTVSVASVAVSGEPGSISSDTLVATAGGGCTPCSRTGSASIENLRVSGGPPFSLAVGCNIGILPTPPSLTIIKFNEQGCTPGGTHFVNALHITVPGIVDIIVSHAEAAPTGCSCPAGCLPA